MYYHVVIDIYVENNGRTLYIFSHYLNQLMGYSAYRTGEQRRIWRGCAFVQTRQNLHCSHKQNMEVLENLCIKQALRNQLELHLYHYFLFKGVGIKIYNYLIV